MRIHPFLLFRCANSNKNNIGVGLTNLSLNVLLLAFAQGAKRGGVGTRDFETRKALAKPRYQSRERVRTTAVKENTMSVFSRLPAELEHQTRPIDSLLLL